MNDNKKEVAPEVPVQEQPQNNELVSALLRITNMLEYQNQSDKVINGNFKKIAMINDGKISITINISNLSSKELLNALDKLQDFSNILMFDEIPNSIIKS